MTDETTFFFDCITENNSLSVQHRGGDSRAALILSKPLQSGAAPHAGNRPAFQLKTRLVTPAQGVSVTLSITIRPSGRQAVRPTLTHLTTRGLPRPQSRYPLEAANLCPRRATRTHFIVSMEPPWFSVLVLITTNPVLESRGSTVVLLPQCRKLGR